MTAKIKLKNRDQEFVTIDLRSLEYIKSDKHLMSLKFLDNMRAHSNGYAVFQRCVTTAKGPVYETIYLHKLIGEKFLKKPKSDKKLFISFKDGNVQNATIDNLQWVTMGEMRRHMKSVRTKTGYRGVTKEKGRYRAVIYDQHKAINLGFFDTAIEAAKAYNKKSIELFGRTRGLNDV